VFLSPSAETNGGVRYDQGEDPGAATGHGAFGVRRLWRAVQAEYELEEHETALLREMCRTVD
jgi:hypothetical protein